MICHVATFVLLGLGSIYEMKVLTFSALVSLMVGLFFGKEALETSDYEQLINDNEKNRLKTGENDDLFV